jgi:sporulation protein YqfD
MSGYIWEVEVLATDGVNVEDFTESLGDLGVKIGARKSKIDIIQVQNQLMNEYSELLWVSLNIFGGKVQVEMSEFVEQKEITDTKTPVNIVAKKKGEIVLVKGYNGVNAVKEGENVTKGTLLISGVVKNFDGSEHFTHAKGEIFAKTKNKEKINCPFENQALTTTQKKNRYYLYVFSLKIPLGLKAEGDFLSQSTEFLKSGKTVLPFGIIREDNFSALQSRVEYSPEEVMLTGLLEGVKKKREIYNNTQLQSVKYDFSEGKNYGEISIEINCIEDIAEEKLNTKKMVLKHWQYGTKSFIPLYEDGEFESLAEYIVKKETKEDQDGCTYSRSRNLIVPEPKREIIHSKRWRQEPKPEKGWYIVPDSLVNGENPVTGYPYQHYTMKKLDPGGDDG